MYNTVGKIFVIKTRGIPPELASWAGGMDLFSVIDILLPKTHTIVIETRVHTDR